MKSKVLKNFTTIVYLYPTPVMIVIVVIVIVQNHNLSMKRRWKMRCLDKGSFDKIFYMMEAMGIRMTTMDMDLKERSQ